MTSRTPRLSARLRAPALILAAAILLTACGDRGGPAPDSPATAWPEDLVPPIQGATFSMSPQHLPGYSLGGSAAASRGFAFFNGASGRPLTADDPVVAVAAGQILRIDTDYTEADEATQRHWAALADQPGFLGQYARDRLRGRQVWIRHESGHVTRYAHLAAVHPELSAGSEIEQEQAIGLMGRSGLPPAEDTQPPARLHFELWSPDGERYLGQELEPIEVHMALADIFGFESLPRYAREAVEDAREDSMPAGPYPPEDPPNYDFAVEAPDSIAAGAPFAIAITWEGEAFSPGAFYPMLGSDPLGVIDAGNGAWILGAMPLESAGESQELTVAAISPLGTTLAGSVSIDAGQIVESKPPIEVDANTLERLTSREREREDALLERVGHHSMATWQPEWSEPFQAPLEEGTVTATFAQKRYHGVSLPAHPLPGVLLRVDAGPAVHAANSGTVAIAEALPVRGETVAISHGGGIVSVYAGLSAIDVEPGTLIERGETLGQAGDTLQWEIHAAGTPSNPLLWLEKLLPSGE